MEFRSRVGTGLILQLSDVPEGPRPLGLSAPPSSLCQLCFHAGSPHRTTQCWEEDKYHVFLVSMFLDLSTWQASLTFYWQGFGPMSIPQQIPSKGLGGPQSAQTSPLGGRISGGSGSHRHHFRPAGSGWRPPQCHECSRLLAHSDSDVIKGLSFTIQTCLILRLLWGSLTP